MRRRGVLWGTLAAIVALAFTLRVWGIDNGLPYSQVTDESYDVSTSLKIAAGESPHYALHRVGWPISQLPVHGLHYIYLYLSHPGFGLDDFENHYFTHRGDFLLSIRLYVAALTSLSVIGVYLTVWLLTRSDLGGLVAALLLAVHPTHAYMSHMALPDGYALTWIVIALLSSVYIAKTGARWAYILSGVAVALILLARLPVAVIVVSVMLAHVIHWWQQPGRPRKLLLTRWLWAFGAFVVTCLIFNPFLVLDYDRAVANFMKKVNERYRGQSNLATLWMWTKRNAKLPVIMMRPYLFVTALIGAAIAIVRRDRYTMIILAFALVFVLALSPVTRPKITYLLPAIIPAVMFTGYAVAVIRQGRVRWQQWGTAAVVLVVIGWSLVEARIIDRALAAPNTKMAAYDWITQNIPPGAKILSGEPYTYSVPLARNEVSILRVQQLTSLPPDMQFQLDHPDLARQPQYDLFGPEYKPQIVSDEAWWAFVRENQIQYVVESDYCNPWGYRYDSTSDIEFPVITEAVRSELILLETISPFDTLTCQQYIEERLHMQNMKLDGWVCVGPRIRIYQVP